MISERQLFGKKLPAKPPEPQKIAVLFIDYGSIIDVPLDLKRPRNAFKLIGPVDQVKRFVRWADGERLGRIIDEMRVYACDANCVLEGPEWSALKTWNIYKPMHYTPDAVIQNAP